MKELSMIYGNPNQSFEDTFGDEKFEITLQWFEDISTWFLGLRGLTNDFEISGKALEVGVDYFEPYRRQYGALYLIGDERGRPDLSSLGDTFKLYWLTEAEKAEL